MPISIAIKNSQSVICAILSFALIFHIFETTHTFCFNGLAAQPVGHKLGTTTKSSSGTASSAYNEQYHTRMPASEIRLPTDDTTMTDTLSFMLVASFCNNSSFHTDRQQARDISTFCKVQELLSK